MGHIRLMPRLVLTVTVQPTHLATRDVSIQNLVALSILVAAEKKGPRIKPLEAVHVYRQHAW